MVKQGNQFHFHWFNLSVSPWMLMIGSSGIFLQMHQTRPKWNQVRLFCHNITHLPSSVRASLYPLRLRWVTVELRLPTTLFTWSLSNSHHDMFSCSTLHRGKENGSRNHMAWATDWGGERAFKCVETEWKLTWSTQWACQPEQEQRSLSSQSGWAAAALDFWTENWRRDGKQTFISNITFTINSPVTSFSVSENWRLQVSTLHLYIQNTGPG